MLKEAIEKIEELNRPTFKQVDNTVYGDKPMSIITHVKPRIKTVDVSGLPGLVTLVKTETLPRHALDGPAYVEVASPTEVRVFTDLDEDLDRDVWYVARADVPGFKSGYRSYEEFVIELRSRFRETDGSRYLLDLLGRMDITESSTSEDNGITQGVTVRQGVALKGQEMVRPIVPLAPYRTFFDVEQPVSEFLVRVDQKGSVGLFEADGGMWKREAKMRLTEFLIDAFADEIKAKTVQVLF